MKNAEMKQTEFDYTDIITSSTPSFANKFSLLDVNGYPGFTIHGEYGDRTFENSYTNGQPTALVDFLGSTVDNDGGLSFYYNDTEFYTISSIAQHESRNNGWDDFDFLCDYDYMWDSVNQIFTFIQ